MKFKKKKQTENITVENKVDNKKDIEPTEAKENVKSAFSTEMFSEVIVKNPVLVSTIGLCPVVAICISVKSALILTLITYLTMILAQVLSALIFKRMEQWVRIAFYSLTGMGVVAPMMIFMQRYFPNNFVAMGLYLPLMVINPLITRQCERVAVKGTVKEAFINAISCATGYAGVLLIIGFIRELFGRGQFLEFTVFENQPIPSLTSPFAGFLLLGFMSALLHSYFKKIDPQYAEELATHSRSSIKKPTKKSTKKPTKKKSKSKTKSLISEYETNNLVDKKKDRKEKTNLKDKKSSKPKKKKKENKLQKDKSKKLETKEIQVPDDKNEQQKKKVTSEPTVEKENGTGLKFRQKVTDKNVVKQEETKQENENTQVTEKTKQEKENTEAQEKTEVQDNTKNTNDTFKQFKTEQEVARSDNDIITSILEEYNVNYDTQFNKKLAPKDNKSSSREVDELLSMNLDELLGTMSKSEKKDESDGEVPKE